MTTAYELASMTWPEVEAALDHIDVALIPTAAFHQHGPAGSLGRDVARVEGFSRLLAERMHPRALLLPVQAYGLAPLHMGFAGTISLRPTTYLAIYRSVIDSLHRHGLRKFVVLSASTSLMPALQSLANVVRAELPGSKMVYLAYTDLAPEPRGEVGAFSEAMALAPGTVRPDRLGPASRVGGPGVALGGLKHAEPLAKATSCGLTVDVSNASAAQGERMVAAELDALSEWLARYL